MSGAALSPGLLAELRRSVGGGHVSTDPVDLVAHAYDGSYEASRPDAVAWPVDAGGVARLLAACQDAGLPVFPRGAGTGLAGGSVPRGGLALVLTDLVEPCRVDGEELSAEVGAGVVTARLQAVAADRGLLFPPDPSSAATSTLGGNIATGAGGPRAFKYGTTRDYLLGLEVVLADGSRLEVGGHTRKNAAGYDLVHLFAGSEGTLGVITAARLRLVPAPPSVRSLAGCFADLRRAGEAIVALATAGGPCAIELMDQLSLRIVEEHLHLGLPLEAEAVLIVEVDGWPEEVAAVVARAERLLQGCGATELLWPEGGRGSALWRGRKAISAAIARIKPTKISEDVTVPRTRVPEMLGRLREIARRHQLILPIFGHAGDGNLHPNIVCDRRDAEEMRRVEAAVGEIFTAAVELGGVLSGEHGVGSLKAPYMEAAAGAGAMALMRSLKALLDPAGILNPGKVLGPRGRYHG